jgi:hypothetical protein
MWLFFITFEWFSVKGRTLRASGVHVQYKL